MQASHILLFDIDGTLLRTGGAGTQAMSRAFERLYGVADAFAAIDMGGRSDSWILQAALAQHGLPYEPAVREAFVRAYAEALAESLSLSNGQILPGIPALLEALADPAVVRGLGTGNFRRTSLLKLRHFGLAEHFVDGGFGDDSVDRREILAAGVARLRAAARGDAAVVVIGDTTHDIAAAHAIGARAVGVATGRVSAAELAGAGAEVVLPDCADLEGTLAAILG